MATKAQIRTNVLSLLSNNDMIASDDVDALMVADHREILDSYSWSRRKGDSLLTMVAPYSTGTITSSSTTITGTDTTFTSAMVGRFLRTSSSTFFTRITGFTSTTEITIESALPSEVTDASFTIFKHRYNLPTDFGRVISLVSDVYMREASRTDLDNIDPYRSTTATYPELYTLLGLDPDTSGSQIFQTEVWPVPSTATQLRLHYLKANNLSSDSDEPLYRSDVLVWKTAESSCYFLHGKTGDAAWLALSDRFHVRYLESFQAAREDDIGKFSPSWHVKDSMHMGVHGDDFYLDHDDLRLR